MFITWGMIKQVTAHPLSAAKNDAQGPAIYGQEKKVCFWQLKVKRKKAKRSMKFYMYSDLDFLKNASEWEKKNQIITNLRTKILSLKWKVYLEAIIFNKETIYLKKPKFIISIHIIV